MESRSVALQLRTLASEPENQTYMVQNPECIKGLVGLLDSSDDGVLLSTLQSFQFLSSHPLNKASLTIQPGLMGKLAGFIDHENKEIDKFASAILDNLTSVINGAAEKQELKKVDYFKPKYLFQVPLQVPDLESERDVAKIERALLGVPGVVSVTLDRATKQAIAYTRVAESEISDSLVRAIVAAGMQAKSESTSTNSTLAQRATQQRPSYIRRPVSGAEGETAPTVATGAPRYLTKQVQSSPDSANKGARPGYLSGAANRKTSTALAEYKGLQQSSMDARLRLYRIQQEQREKQHSKVEALMSGSEWSTIANH